MERAREKGTHWRRCWRVHYRTPDLIPDAPRTRRGALGSLLRPTIHMPMASPSDALLGFSPDRFERRRRQVLQALGSDVMVLPAAPRVHRAGDSELAYRPDSELFYLTGCTEPDAVLVLRGFAEDVQAILYVPPRDTGQEQWEGVRLGPDGTRERLGIAEVRSNSRIDAELAELLKGSGNIHYRLGTAAPALPFQTRVEAAVLSALRVGRHRGARTGVGPRGVLDPGGILDELRLLKDADEIEALEAAAAASVLGFEFVLDRLARKGSVEGEWQLEAELLRGFREGGGSGPAFAPIVAGGARSCILHYSRNDGALASGDLVLLDAGAEVRLYAGDISRTLPVGGTFSPTQRAVYDLVLAARNAGIAAAQVGTPVSAVHEAASRVLRDGLIELGVLKGSESDEPIVPDAHRAFFPHQTSHWLGLNTHDPGDYVRGGAPRPLEAGMVLTVEPGLYFPPHGLFEGLAFADPDLAAPFRGIGVRIEDDVLITDDGPRVLTAGLPATAEDVEARLR